MLAGIEPPAGAPAPAGAERLDQFGDRAEALRVRSEVNRRRRALRIGDQRLRQGQVPRQRVEHVLPGPYGLGIAQRDRFSRFEGPDDVVHDPER